MKTFKMFLGLMMVLMCSNFAFAVDPIAYYTFDTDASDATGNFNGTLEGDAAIIDEAVRGKVLELSIDGYVSVPPALANGVDDFSFTAWVNFGGANPWAGLMGIGMSAEKTHPYWDFHLKGDNQTIRFYSSVYVTWPSDGCAQLVINYELPPLEWVHIALSFTKNSGAVVYINGVAQELEAWTGDNDYSVSPGDLGADIFWIGRDSFNKQTLTGTYIDDFKFYNTALTQEEVVADYSGVSSVDDNALSVPAEFKLAQNYPNPFNPATKIGFSVPFRTNVRIDVYDVLGRKVAELINEEKPAGRYEVNFVAKNLNSGIYIYQLNYSDRILSRKMMLLK